MQIAEHPRVGMSHERLVEYPPTTYILQYGIRLPALHMVGRRQ